MSWLLHPCFAKPFLKLLNKSQTSVNQICFWEQIWIPEVCYLGEQKSLYEDVIPAIDNIFD